MMSDAKPALKNVIIESSKIESAYLEREVLYDVYLPSNITNADQTSLLLINDGQDLPKMPFDKLLDDLISKNEIGPMVCVGIHCGAERRREYGTSYSADYGNRGDKAGLYEKFIFDELLPAIRKKYHTPSFKEKSFAGFSLGGLSALDIVWNNASEFKNVGVFSGSLWWRRKAYDDGYDDEKDRMMHLQIRYGTMYPWLKFFIQTGTLDEVADRNSNGIIDSIDDALDLILELKTKGYTNEHIRYLQMDDGKHDVPTWGRAFPEFLKWAFKK
ncbi:MAG: alpha/beta hydrolase-fold protein [Bacteroidetes bacterium]|nr:alpha/beta hydrolase-fold protein [Bacteroidota bacterium]